MPETLEAQVALDIADARQQNETLRAEVSSDLTVPAVLDVDTFPETIADAIASVDTTVAVGADTSTIGDSIGSAVTDAGADAEQTVTAPNTQAQHTDSDNVGAVDQLQLRRWSCRPTRPTRRLDRSMISRRGAMGQRPHSTGLRKPRQR